jgi:hypothetical protein
MKLSRLGMTEAAVLRFLYECGYASDVFLSEIFKPRLNPKSTDKKYKVYRVCRFRKFMQRLAEEEGLVTIFRLNIPGYLGRYTGYLLTGRGHDFVRHNLRSMKEGFVGVFGDKKKEVVMSCYDVLSNYRKLKLSGINMQEILHHDFIVRMKGIIMKEFNKRTICPDMLHTDDVLYTKDRCDLLVDIGDKKYIGIEYERSEKTSRQYLGYTYFMNGSTRRHQGIIISRQKEDFLPKPYKLAKIVVLCENDNIFWAYFRYMNKLMTPDIHGRYYKFNNLYLGSKRGHHRIVMVFTEKLFIRGDAEKNFDLRNYSLLEILLRPFTGEEKIETVTCN